MGYACFSTFSSALFDDFCYPQIAQISADERFRFFDRIYMIETIPAVEQKEAKVAKDPRPNLLNRRKRRERRRINGLRSKVIRLSR
jgi:hypothetical protein